MAPVPVTEPRKPGLGTVVLRRKRDGGGEGGRGGAAKILDSQMAPMGRASVCKDEGNLRRRGGGGGGGGGGYTRGYEGGRGRERRHSGKRRYFYNSICIA